MFLRRTQPARNRLAHCLRVDVTVFAGASIGVAGIGDDGAGFAGFHMEHVQLDRRGFDLVAREYAGHGGRDVGYN